ncbi:MAG TPA: creatininase family protein [Byssovorax sp.]|jgi:creatinine amidohydrolase
MRREATTALGEMTTEAVSALVRGGPVAIVLPVGSVEPHGPHLPLATDSILSERAAHLAVERLAASGATALVAPTIPYGVTDFAAGFAGAISIDAASLIAYLRAVVTGYLAASFCHVCVVSNHLEPAHDAAVRASIEGLPRGRASVASPLTRRWARALSAEFKSGACHAGRYETSLVLAARPDLVSDEASRLPPLDASLSDGIRRGVTRFADLGMARAYTGAPAEATAEEGRELYEKLAEMVATETLEGLASIATS